MSKEISRYYNLTENRGSYQSADSLVGWFTFDNNSVGRTNILSDGKLALSGSLIGTLPNGSPLRRSIESFQVETPTFLKGDQFINRASLSLSSPKVGQGNSDKIKGFEVSDFALLGNANQVSLPTSTFSFMVRFPNLDPAIGNLGSDAKIMIASVADAQSPDGRFSLSLDFDGAATGIPAITLKMSDDQGNSTATWSIPIASSALIANAILRDWVNITFVINDPSWQALTNATTTWLTATNASGQNYASVYINGVHKSGTTAGIGNVVSVTQADVRQLMVGGSMTNVSVASATVGMVVGEFSTWKNILGAIAINYLYKNQIGDGPRNPTGPLSNPLAGTVGDCGECDHDAYPTIRRTTDQRRLGMLSPHFDDTTTWTMPTSASLVGDFTGHYNKINYPTLLQSGAIAQSAVGLIIDTPNTLPTIFTTASLSGSRGYANVIGSYPNCSASRDFSDPYKPFNDAKARVDVATQAGPISDVLPGFTNRLGDRVIIDIDITLSESVTLSVMTGTNGDVYGSAGEIKQTDSNKTGLVYYNFTRNRFDFIGGKNQETGLTNNWNLPGEVSSSAAFTFWTLADSGDGGFGMSGFPKEIDFFEARGGLGGATPGTWNTAMGGPSAFYESFERVPRIFQPFSSLVSHRNTFNHTCQKGYPDISPNTFEHFKGRSLVQLLPTSSMETVRRKFKDADNNNPGAFQIVGSIGYEDSGGLVGPGFGGSLGAEHEWLTYDDDIAGIGLVQATDDNTSAGLTSPVYQKLSGSIIWNNTEDCARSSVVPKMSAYDRLFKTAGRPIAYTRWARNSVFHANNEQLLDLSGYINGPILLEGFEVIQSVKALRYQNPYMNTFPLTTPDGKAYAAQTSNTNNHIDFLTYFLLRQENPYHSTASLVQKSRSSVRELITWSNHVFASPFVGWDHHDSTCLQTDTTSKTGGSQLNVPVGGARISRVFEVSKEHVVQNLPACDNFRFYVPDSGMLQTAHGANGIFFSKEPNQNQIAWGVPVLYDLEQNRQPQPRWVTASMNIDRFVPVRICNAYAQHITPILPKGPGWHAYSNGLPRYVGWNNGSILTAEGYFEAKNNTYFFQGQNPNPPDITPRFALMCMGTYWPGGTGLAETTPRIPLVATIMSESLHPEIEGGRGLLSFKWDSFSHPMAFAASGSKSNRMNWAGIPTTAIAKASTTSPRSVVFARNSKGTRVTGGRPRMVWQNADLGIIGNRKQGFSTSFAMSAQPGQNKIAQGMRRRAPPQYFEWDVSGSAITKSGYVLMPEDKLIFGAQWSPADAVHRSFKAIKEASRNLTYYGAGAGSQNVPNIQGGGTPRDHGYDLPANLHAYDVGQQAYRIAGYSEANDLVNVASASCTIENKTSKLRLYGVLLQNQTQKHHSLPQQLTTLCVHEVVGNEAIVDQYDIATRKEFESSRASDLVSGTMSNNMSYFFKSDRTEPQAYNTEAVGGGLKTSTGYLAVSGADNFKGRGVRRSQENKNLYDLGTVRRVSVHEDMSEFYYDSLAPDVEAMFAVDGITVVQQDQYKFMGTNVPTHKPTGDASIKLNHFPIALVGNEDNIDANGNWTLQSTDASDPAVSSNRMFGRSFPFEPRYAGIQRKASQNARPAYTVRDKQVLKTDFLIYSGDTTDGRLTGNGWWGFSPANHGRITTDYTWVGTAGGSSIIAEPAVRKTVQPIKKRVSNGRTGHFVAAKPQAGLGGMGTIFANPGSPTTPPGTNKYPWTAHFLTASKIPDHGFPEGWYLNVVKDKQDTENWVRNNWNFSGSKAGNNLVGFFGVGNNQFGTLDWSYIYQVINEPTSSNVSLTTFKLLAEKPRGFRYGLISATPRRTTAVWRRDSFGQFRDMLEQRHSTVSFLVDPPDVASDRLAAGKHPRNGVRRGFATRARFRKPVFEDPSKMGAAARTSPYDTSCSNLNKFCTSSMPFFDGQSKNRDPAASSAEVVVE